MLQGSQDLIQCRVDGFLLETFQCDGGLLYWNQGLVVQVHYVAVVQDRKVFHIVLCELATDDGVCLPFGLSPSKNDAEIHLEEECSAPEKHIICPSFPLLHFFPVMCPRP